jgi:hypothetical protein
MRVFTHAALTLQGRTGSKELLEPRAYVRQEADKTMLKYELCCRKGCTGAVPPCVLLLFTIQSEANLRSEATLIHTCDCQSICTPLGLLNNTCKCTIPTTTLRCCDPQQDQALPKGQPQQAQAARYSAAQGMHDTASHTCVQPRHPMCAPPPPMQPSRSLLSHTPHRA